MPALRQAVACVQNYRVRGQKQIRNQPTSKYTRSAYNLAACRTQLAPATPLLVLLPENEFAPKGSWKNLTMHAFEAQLSDRMRLFRGCTSLQKYVHSIHIHIYIYTQAYTPSFERTLHGLPDRSSHRESVRQRVLSARGIVRRLHHN